MSESKVEVTGFEARHYDKLMNFLTFGSYPLFIRRAIQKMNIRPKDKILDMGCGTGRNSCLMVKYLSDAGSIIGLDIGEEMIQNFERKCQKFSNVMLQKRRIEEPLPFEGEFDKVFISFVFHGFPDDQKEFIVKNAKKALKKGGEFFILDYNEFDLEQKSWPIRKGFKKVECPLAFDYIKGDWKKWLSERGFGNFTEDFFYWKIVRLLKAEKL
ncbi:MAG: methyltransferase domain-containing protein [Calditrichaeota bacterium]|nr:methyltransferase domain-containing protein [Calditrichota bacterium]